jgi:hypothetical protein
MVHDDAPAERAELRMFGNGDFSKHRRYYAVLHGGRWAEEGLDKIASAPGLLAGTLCGE